jgi:hypothetical protein
MVLLALPSTPIRITLFTAIISPGRMVPPGLDKVQRMDFIVTRDAGTLSGITTFPLKTQILVSGSKRRLASTARPAIICWFSRTISPTITTQKGRHGELPWASQETIPGG